MKKLILTLVFVFAMGMFSELSATTLNVERDCAAEAFEMQGEMESYGFSKEEANEWASDFYDNCE